jgi:hypothetical protein
MNLKLSLALVLGITCTTPLVSVSQESTTTAPPQATFPPSTKCATATPCRNVTGEVVKIEESYWIQFPSAFFRSDGSELTKWKSPRRADR